jgi:hypothetical protein
MARLDEELFNRFSAACDRVGRKKDTQLKILITEWLGKEGAKQPEVEEEKTFTSRQKRTSSL